MRVQFKLIGIIAILACGLYALRADAHLGHTRNQITVEQSLPAEGITSVKSTVVTGTIHVFADASQTVQIHAVRTVTGGSNEEQQRWLKEPRLVIKCENDVIRIEDIIPKSLQEENRHANPVHMNLALDLRLPSPIAVHATTAVGDVIVEGRHGNLTAQIGAGNVHLKQLDCSKGSLEAQTGAGSIEGNGRAGNIRVQTGAGNIHLKPFESSGNTLSAETGVGDIELRLHTLPSRNLSINVGTGKVHLGLPSDAQANVDLHCGMGKVNSAFPLNTGHHDAFDMGGHASGKIHGGGARIHAEVGVGSIHLEQE